MEFDQIILSKDELSVLKKLRDAHREKKEIPVTPENRDIFDRLVHLELAKVQFSADAAPDDKVSFPFPKTAHITERGLDYLAYLDGKEKERHRDWRRDIALSLFGAVIGSLITLLFEHAHDLVNLARVFFQAIRE